MRLWVRLSLLISGLLLLTALLAIISALVLIQSGAAQPPPAQIGPKALLNQPYRLLVVSVVVVGFSIMLGVLVSRMVSQPIAQLASAARRIGAGDLTPPAPISGSSELVALSNAFSAMVADLKRAEELRANLIADVSHELRTPLTVLEGNLRAALDHVYALDEATVADLYSQVQHLIHLVNDLRELALADARQLPLQQRPTDLAALLDETLRVFAPLAEDEGVRLTLVSPPLPLIEVDPQRLRQALHNLLANALRYTASGGEIVLASALEPDGITLSVRDSGIGLSAEQQAHIFDRFYRGDTSRSRETGGAGLGLAIVKAIIEAHSGQAWVESAGPGAGATFFLYLPRT